MDAEQASANARPFAGARRSHEPSDAARPAGPPPSHPWGPSLGSCPQPQSSDVLTDAGRSGSWAAVSAATARCPVGRTSAAPHARVAALGHQHRTVDFAGIAYPL